MACIAGTTTCTATDADGNFRFYGLASGIYDVAVSATGYYSLTLSATVVNPQTIGLYYALSPTLAAGQMRIVLTWGASPADLDANLWLPQAYAYHVYWWTRGYCSNSPYACLNVDDFKGGMGPETITITQLLTGQYVYAVYDYKQSGQLPVSGATVRLYDSGGLFRTFTVPTGPAISGAWWYVFDLDGLTRALTIHDTVSNVNPAPYTDPTNPVTPN